MENNFILSCESTCDLPLTYVKENNIPILFYSYVLNNEVLIDDMGEKPEAKKNFYNLLETGSIPKTSQLNVIEYKEFFYEQLKKGDILHITFGTGMTNSYQNALIAKKELEEEFKDRKIYIVDSLCSSSGYGMLVCFANDLKNQGHDIEYIYNWLLNNRNKIHHQFFSTDLKYFKRSGRISFTSAILGTMFGICPIMHLDKSGKIVAYQKARGKKNAILKTIEELKNHAENGILYNNKLFISHSNQLEDALRLKEAILNEFKNIKDIPIYDIGSIIASHCGPGTIACYFLGDERI